MSDKIIPITLVIILVAIAGAVGYLALQGRVALLPPGENIGKPPVATSSYPFLVPVAGEQWQAGKEYVIRWQPPMGSTIALSVVNPSFGSGYRFHICAPVSPYPCDLPNTGEFRWLVPPDDGHNEWAPSAEYRIALAPTSSDAPMSVSGPFSIMAKNAVVVPAAPGPFAADAVRNLAPQSLKVGKNEITAEVRGYMFFEGETQLALYDGTARVNIGNRPDGLPNGVVSAKGAWMTEDYVPVAQTITIPAGLKGKTLVIRFIANDPRDDARPRYWGTLIRVE
jgi:hypothetical protein